MRQRRALKPYHAILRDGVVVGVGKGDYSTRPGQDVIEFDSEKERALHGDVAEWELQNSLNDIDKQVNSLKADGAYTQKESEARRLLENPKLAKNLSAEMFPYTYDEAEETSMEPLEIARRVIAAVERENDQETGTRAQERKRIKLRERAKRIRATGKATT